MMGDGGSCFKSPQVCPAKTMLGNDLRLEYEPPRNGPQALLVKGSCNTDAPNSGALSVKWLPRFHSVYGPYSNLGLSATGPLRYLPLKTNKAWRNVTVPTYGTIVYPSSWCYPPSHSFRCATRFVGWGPALRQNPECIGEALGRRRGLAKAQTRKNIGQKIHRYLLHSS